MSSAFQLFGAIEDTVKFFHNLVKKFYFNLIISSP